MDLSLGLSSPLEREEERMIKMMSLLNHSPSPGMLQFGEKKERAWRRTAKTHCQGDGSQL